MGHETSDETRRKIGEAQGRLRGTHYYNNGIKCIKAFECPEGYVKGKLKLVKDGKQKVKLQKALEFVNPVTAKIKEGEEEATEQMTEPSTLPEEV